MNRSYFALVLSGLAALLVGFVAIRAQVPPKSPAGKRLEVLFLGDDRGHKPIERYRVLKQVLGPKGVNLTFVEDLGKITTETLSRYDVLLVYANHEQDRMPPDILTWVKEGGALVALHSACGNFHPSKEWFDLVGGRFASHEGHEFSPRTVDDKHPITKDLPVLQCWDETYVHRDLTKDRHLLQVREPVNQGETEPEPWTWTRQEGKGRVFYTASGHDLRCWNEPAYQELVYRGILWSVGDKRAAEFQSAKLPKLEFETPKLKDRAHPDVPMMPLQKPLSPQDSAAHTQVPAGSHLELYASEPMVVNPIALNWDERGRLWVVESFGYPNDVPSEPGKGKDRIKILTDTNGDGKADQMTVFAEGLRHCTTLTFSQGGVIATDGPDIVFLKDENGDGKADTRKVLATGLKLWDTHASTSHFFYGLDNWIYATVGYSGVDMEVAGKKIEFGSAVFRFRPDLSKLEHLQDTTNNTWGLGFTEEGDVLGSTANNNPSWILSIPAAAYAGSNLKQPKTPRVDASTIIYPNTLDFTQVDQINRFTAAAGHSFYTDNLFAGTFEPSDAFVCEPTAHLVAVTDVVDRDSLKAAHYRGNNLYASADAWSAPVAALPGPDGAVWVADWYNPIVQHNVVFRFWNPAHQYDQPHSPYHTGPDKPGAGNAYVTPLRDQTHGRIWRIVPDSPGARRIVPLDPKDPRMLVSALRSPSQQVRLHAQRLLIERGGEDLVTPLGRVIAAALNSKEEAKPLAAVHALWTLEGLGAEPGSAAHNILRTVLLSNDAPQLLRRHAMLALGPNDPAVIGALPDLLTETENPRERLLVLVTAAQSSANEVTAQALWKWLAEDKALDDTQQEAATLAMYRQGVTLLAVAFDSMKGDFTEKWKDQALLGIATHVAKGPNRQALVSLLDKAPEAARGRLEAILKDAGFEESEEVPLPEHLVGGRNVYMKSCVECHQADGNGVENTFPPLAGSEWVKGDPRTLLRIIVGGLAGPIEVKSVAYDSIMPGHSHNSDEEIAAVASYIRYAFADKKEKAFPVEEVGPIRAEVEERKFAPWTVEELKKAGSR